MPLIIAHGLPKSGSTFLYQVTKEIAAQINGFSHYKGKEVFFPGMNVPDFVQDPTDEFVDSLLARLPPGAAFVVKTHGRITPLLASRIGSGKIKVVMSFRDPRDTVISMLDAGASDRSKGNKRFFTKLYDVDDAIGPAKSGWKTVRGWFDCPNLLLIPYYLIAARQSWVVDRLCEYLGAAQSRHRINADFSRDKHSRITEYHKGVADRFLDDLTPSQVQMLGRKLSVEIAEADALAEQRMAELGFRMLYHHMRQERDSRLAAIA